MKSKLLGLILLISSAYYSVHGQLTVNDAVYPSWQLLETTSNSLSEKLGDTSSASAFRHNPTTEGSYPNLGYARFITATEGSYTNLLIPKDHLAFFCRVELHLEKAARLPVKFRLGSVDYVDRLEGKRAW